MLFELGSWTSMCSISLWVALFHFWATSVKVCCKKDETKHEYQNSKHSKFNCSILVTRWSTLTSSQLMDWHLTSFSVKVTVTFKDVEALIDRLIKMTKNLTRFIFGRHQEVFSCLAWLYDWKGALLDGELWLRWRRRGRWRTTTVLAVSATVRSMHQAQRLYTFGYLFGISTSNDPSSQRN
jgi:hypothetical protein